MPQIEQTYMPSSSYSYNSPWPVSKLVGELMSQRCDPLGGLKSLIRRYPSQFTDTRIEDERCPPIAELLQAVERFGLMLGGVQGLGGQSLF
jgi:hypothetical protein